MVTEMLVANFIITCVSMWIIFLINNKFIQPALHNKKRFRLFELRDDLSVLAMKGEIDEISVEYKTLLCLINSAVAATGTFKVTDFLRFLVKLHTDVEIKNRIGQIQKNLKKSENTEYCRIARDYFSTMHIMLNSDTRTLRVIFFPVFLFVGSILAFVNLKELQKKLSQKRRLIAEVDKDLNGYSDSFGSFCPSS